MLLPDLLRSQVSVRVCIGVTHPNVEECRSLSSPKTSSMNIQTSIRGFVSAMIQYLPIDLLKDGSTSTSLPTILSISASKSRSLFWRWILNPPRWHAPLLAKCSQQDFKTLCSGHDCETRFLGQRSSRHLSNYAIKLVAQRGSELKLSTQICRLMLNFHCVTPAALREKFLVQSSKYLSHPLFSNQKLIYFSLLPSSMISVVQKFRRCT